MRWPRDGADWLALGDLSALVLVYYSGLALLGGVFL